VVPAADGTTDFSVLQNELRGGPILDRKSLFDELKVAHAKKGRKLDSLG
jgi:hypothetical protein